MPDTSKKRSEGSSIRRLFCGCISGTDQTSSEPMEEDKSIHFYSGIKDDCNYGFAGVECGSPLPHVYEEISEAEKGRLPLRYWKPHRSVPLVEPYEIIPIPTVGGPATRARTSRFDIRLSDPKMKSLFEEFLREHWVKDHAQAEGGETYGQSSNESGISVWNEEEEPRTGGASIDGSLPYCHLRGRARPLPPKRTSSTRVTSDTFLQASSLLTTSNRETVRRRTSNLTFAKTVSETIHV